MSKRIEIGTLFLLFGLALLSTENGKAQIGAISYTVTPAFLIVLAVVAFVVSGLYCLSSLLWLTKRSWLTRSENFVLSHFPKFLIYPTLTVYFSALFIVFTQGLVMGVTRLPWENFRLPLLVFGLVWIVFLGINHIGQAYRLGKSARQNRARISGRNEWLGNIVNNEMRLRNPPVSFFTWLGLKKPSWRTVSIIGCLFGLSITISWVVSIFAPSTFLISEDKLRDSYLAMWQVQGAIAAFALPLLIVVIEFSKDLRHVAGKRPEALIRESWIFPIIVFALFGTVRLGIDIYWFLNELVFIFDLIFILIGTICFSIIAYMRMLSILLNTQKMKQYSLALIKDLMASQLDKTIRQRIANNILLRDLRELGLEVTPFSGTRQEDKEITLRYHNPGILCDINIGKLASFVKELPRKDFNAKESTGTVGSDFESVQKPSARKYPQISWTKRYGQAITPEDNSLIVLDKSQYDISGTADLEAQLISIVRVKQEKDKAEDVKELIGYIRDGLIDSIRECKAGAVEEGLGIYEELISTFLEKLQQWEATYKRDTATRESHSLGGGWGEIMWIRDDLHEIIDMAVRTEHIGVLQEVLYFPFKMAIKAIRCRDYYIFQQFLDWIPYYYTMTSSMKDARAREFIISRCSMHLSEMLRYYTCPKIESSKEEGDIENANDFTLGIIFIFNRLLKIAYDNKEIEHFKGFSATVNSAFEFLFRHSLDSEVVSLEYQLRHQALSDTQKARIEQQLSLERKRMSVVNTLRETIDIMFYGLKAWMLHEYIDITDKITPDDSQKWDEAIPSPSNLQEAWKIFSSAKQANHDNFDWSHWESKEHERGAAYAGIMVFWGGGFDNYLRMLFCAQCLKVIGRMNEENRKSAKMPHSHDIIFLAENESSPLKQLLKQIEQNKNKWKDIIGENGLKAIQAFEDILDEAVQEQKKEENELIKAADLSAERVDLVKQEIVDAWENNAEFRQIVRQHGNYEPVGAPSEGRMFFGFNQLQPKDMYTEGSDVGIEGWGAQFGRDLANSENERFIEIALTNFKEFKGEQDTTQIVTAALNELEEAKYNPIIIILNSWGSYDAIEKSESFIKEKSQSGYGLVGHFRKRPVYNLNYHGKPHILLIDLKKFCVWRQYKPQQMFDGEEYLGDDLTFLVRRFTEESARDAIKQNSKLLLDKQGNQRPEVEVISELQLQVHFRLLEQFELEIRDKDSGYKLLTQW
jgi:hypothetical protein